MRFFGRGLRRWSETRRAIRAIERLAAAAEQQTAYLKRLADQFAPELAPEEEAAAPREASVAYLDPGEAIETMRYTNQLLWQIGRGPTEAELEKHLDEWRESPARGAEARR